MGVLAKTTMIKDVADIFENEFDRVTLSLRFPDCLDDLKGNDASFELVSSNTLQPLVLIHSHNNVTKSIAVIFVNTEANSTKHRENRASREKMYRELF